MKQTLLLTLEYPPDHGGIARYLGGIVTHYSGRIKVLSPHNGRLLFKYFWPRWLGSIIVLYRIRDSFDRLWTSNILPLGTVAYLFNKIFGKKYVIFMHGYDFYLAKRNAWKRFLTKRILLSSELIVTNTDALGREVESFAQVKSRIVVYPFVLDKIAARAPDVKIHPKDFTLITLSRLVRRKGHVLVLEALARPSECP